MQHPMQKLLTEVPQRTMEVRRLAAAAAVTGAQSRPTIQAVMRGAGLGAMPVRNRYGIDFLRRQPRRNQGSNFREVWTHARTSLGLATDCTLVSCAAWHRDGRRCRGIQPGGCAPTVSAF